MPSTAISTPLTGLGLPILRARVTMRLLADAQLPSYQGAMLRGGFGVAFKRASCPQTCWNHPSGCAIDALCPYRWVFETPHPPAVSHLHDLHDVPRPFVIEPPHDGRTHYAAGDALEFGLVLIGRGIDHLPYFLFSFEQLGRMGLGGARTPARLERVEALRPWQPIGVTIYQDGRVVSTTGEQRTKNKEQDATAHGPRTTADGLPIYDAASIAARAAMLPADLRLALRTPLRVKARGAFIEAIDLGAIVQAVCWRLNALATFHGDGPWDVDHRALVAQAHEVVVEQAQARWIDWERTSSRGPQPRSMKLGGIVGGALLRGVPEALRAVLLAGSLVHVGKACVFGHGEYRLERVSG
jgi:CRISPR-associated endoribonuclease Cas6